MSFVVEVIVDRAVNAANFCKTSHSTEAKHRPVLSDKPKVSDSAYPDMDQGSAKLTHAFECGGSRLSLNFGWMKGVVPG